MMSIGKEGLKFVTCLHILLFISSRSIVLFCGCLGQKIGLFLDEING